MHVITCEPLIPTPSRAGAPLSPFDPGKPGGPTGPGYPPIPGLPGSPYNKVHIGKIQYC